MFILTKKSENEQKIQLAEKKIKEATKNAVLKDGELNLPDDIKKKHHDLAYHAAAESMTLLKNNNGIFNFRIK